MISHEGNLKDFSVVFPGWKLSTNEWPVVQCREAGHLSFIIVSFLCYHKAFPLHTRGVGGKGGEALKLLTFVRSRKGARVRKSNERQRGESAKEVSWCCCGSSESRSYFNVAIAGKYLIIKQDLCACFIKIVGSELRIAEKLKKICNFHLPVGSAWVKGEFQATRGGEERKMMRTKFSI